MNLHDINGGASKVLDDLALKLLLFALRAPTNQLSDIVSWHAHVPFACGFVGIFKPRLIVELGVHKGDSYITLCQAMKDHQVDGTAIGIDTWQGDPQAGFYDGDQILSVLKEKHDPNYAAFSQLLRKTFDEALDDIEDGSVDLLHIDGLHTYEAVKHDFESWLPKLSRRAVVLFHDTIVKQHDFGVWKLWDEISKGRECYNFPYGNGLGVLVVGDETDASVRNLLRMLREDYHYAGLPIREILARIGTGIESRSICAALAAEMKRIHEDRLGERATAQAVIDRLHAEQASERAQAKAAIERLKAEIKQ